MIKKVTDEILDYPKERDVKQKTQDEAVSTCKNLIIKFSFLPILFITFLFLVIQNSGSHMEHTILASLTSILIGFVIMDNQNNETVVRRYLRDGNFKEMVATLVQYYDFLNLTVSVNQTSIHIFSQSLNLIYFLV